MEMSGFCIILAKIMSKDENSYSTFIKARINIILAFRSLDLIQTAAFFTEATNLDVTNK